MYNAIGLEFGTQYTRCGVTRMSRSFSSIFSNLQRDRLPGRFRYLPFCLTEYMQPFIKDHFGRWSANAYAPRHFIGLLERQREIRSREWQWNDNNVTHLCEIHYKTTSQVRPLKHSLLCHLQFDNWVTTLFFPHGRLF